MFNRDVISVGNVLYGFLVAESERVDPSGKKHVEAEFNVMDIVAVNGRGDVFVEDMFVCFHGNTHVVQAEADFRFCAIRQPYHVESGAICSTGHIVSTYCSFFRAVELLLNGAYYHHPSNVSTFTIQYMYKGDGAPTCTNSTRHYISLVIDDTSEFISFFNCCYAYSSGLLHISDHPVREFYVVNSANHHESNHFGCTLNNIIPNAINKGASSGTMLVSSDLSSIKRYLLCTCEDTGCGIPNVPATEGPGAEHVDDAHNVSMQFFFVLTSRFILIFISLHVDVHLCVG